MNFRAALLQEGTDEKTLDEFWRWHNANPMVWKAFEEKALEGINKGLKKWGAKGIAEVIRWDMAVETKTELKFDNNFAPLYARIFALKWPLFKDFFEFRELRK